MDRFLGPQMNESTNYLEDDSGLRRMKSKAKKKEKKYLFKWL